MSRLIIIQPSGETTLHTGYKDHPFYSKCPHFEILCELMELPPKTLLAHVSIKYEGQLAHLFCDEDGIAKELTYNELASNLIHDWRNFPPYKPIFFYGPIAIWTGDYE